MDRQNVIVVIAPTLEVWGNFKKLCESKGIVIIYELKKINMNTEPKPVEERDTLDLLELVCQLHSRALSQPRNKNMHDAYVEARQEMERRIKVNNNFVLADVSRQSELLFAFIKAIKEEFADQNWNYLDFIADRVIGKQ